MATVKIDTAVDAQVFAAFYNVFQKFGQGVHDQTAAWGKVASAGGEARGTIEDAARSVRALADTMDDVLARTRGLDDETAKVSRKWTSLARGTKDAAGHIKDATGSLLKWAGITGLVAGVAGFGAEHLIFGLGRSVSANRSTAMGLGTTYGGLAAARVGYGRFGDAEGLLGRIADAQNDPSKQLPFGALGMGRGDYQGRDSADVMADVMRRAKDVLDKVPDDQLGNRARTSHLDEFFSLEEMRRIKNASSEEVGGAARGIQRDRSELDLTPKVQRQWQDFTTKLTLAGATIETVFVNRLVALEPGLLKLSEAATKIATALLAKDGPVSQWIGELDHGLEWLAKNVDDPKFQRQVGDFVTKIVEIGTAAWGLAKSAGGLLHWLAKLTGSEDVKASGDSMALATGTPGDAIGGHGSAHLGGRHGFGSRSVDAGGDGVTGRGFKGGNTDLLMSSAEDQLRKEGVDASHVHAAAAALVGNVMQESRGNPNLVHDHGTGYGIYGARLDRRDRMLDWLHEHHFAQNSDEGQARYMAHEAMSDRHYGRTAAALRGATHDNLGSTTNTVATDFENPAPATANYQGRRNNAAAAESSGMAGLRSGRTTVSVNKNPGGNPSQTAAMAAAPQ